MKFDRCGDVKLYLVNSIIMYNGKPVSVVEADELGGGKFEIKLLDLDTDEVVCTDTDDELLELDPPKLGYINSGGQAIYLHRDPVRHYKRGLSGENVRNQHFNSSKVSTIAKNDYPSLSTALDSVRHDMVKSCAFSTCFSIDKTSLYFKKRKVGKVAVEEVQLYMKFGFLSHKLKESVNG